MLVLPASWLHEKLQVEHKVGFLPIGILCKFEPIASDCGNQLLLMLTRRTRSTPLQDAAAMALHPNIKAINSSSIEDGLKVVDCELIMSDRSINKSQNIAKSSWYARSNVG